MIRPLGDRTVGEVADGVRTLLAAIKAGELTSAAYRHRLEGAVVALESLSGSGEGQNQGRHMGHITIMTLLRDHR